MSLRLYWTAVDVDIPLPLRHLLEIMAATSCDECGYHWTGNDTTATKNQSTKRTVQRGQTTLIKLGYIKQLGESKGGQGNWNKYVVFPSMARLPAPCSACMKRMRPGRRLGKTPTTETVAPLVAAIEFPTHRTPMTDAERMDELVRQRAQAQELIKKHAEK